MSRALYRKYRSKNLDEIIGQDHITSVLKTAIKTNRIAHAYLLTGPRGVGKTSIARILAHEINQIPYSDEASHIDIIEIDGASNNSVEDVRELREKAMILPTDSAKKIYIIDEVHMLSKSAFNALLKILEEPPEHIVFILATTSPEKLPETILSRVQHFRFNLISQENITKHLLDIAKKENIKITKDAVNLIAKRGRGSFRDSITLFDQVSILSSEEEISLHQVEQVLGMASSEVVSEIINAYLKSDIVNLQNAIKNSANQGISSDVLADQLIDEMMESVAKNPSFIPIIENLLHIRDNERPDVAILVAFLKNSTVKQLTNDTPKATPLTVKQKVVKTISSSPQKQQKNPTPVREKEEPVKTAQPKKPISGKIKPAEIDWNEFLDKVKLEGMSIFTLVQKCQIRQTENQILLYSGTQFFKNKLDDPKYRLSITKVLAEMGYQDFELEVIAEHAPPQDEKLAAIADIMGGGTEVEIPEGEKQ